MKKSDVDGRYEWKVWKQQGGRGGMKVGCRGSK